MDNVTTKLEEKFRAWAKPPGETEEQKCDNAVDMVKDAIDADPALSSFGIKPFGTGSAVAGTNVKTESDADIAIPHGTAAFGYSVPQGRLPAEFGISPLVFDESRYKDMVEAALVKKFGRKSVIRGNKAIAIRENSYRVKADAVPCMEYREYTGRFNAQGLPEYRVGTRLRTDDGRHIINWPHHALRNGIEKNKTTGTRYKSVVRVLKKLKYEMADAQFADTGDFPSFLIQSITWNVPDIAFEHEGYVENVRTVMQSAYGLLQSQDLIAKLREENGIKDLFHHEQAWTVDQLKYFLERAWDFCDFK